MSSTLDKTLPYIVTFSDSDKNLSETNLSIEDTICGSYISLSWEEVKETKE